MPSPSSPSHRKVITPGLRHTDMVLNPPASLIDRVPWEMAGAK